MCFFFYKKSQTDQFYAIVYNFQYDCWIRLKFYTKSPEILTYIG
jgi:hypothetical protein